MPRKAAVGIRDIAEEAGVSIGTVSRILNNKTDGVRISIDTRQRVTEIARRLSYQPNPFASALRSNRTGIIGAVNLNPGGWFMGRLGVEVQLAAQKRGVELFVATVNNRVDSAEAQLTILQGQLFDGFLLLGDMPSYRDAARKSQFLDKPYVCVAAGANIQAPMVHTDEARGMKLILDYLIGLGHRKIAFMGSMDWPLVAERYQLFREYLTERGFAIPDNYVSAVDYFPYQPEAFDALERLHRVAIQHAKSLLQQPNPPTAIFCAADAFALAALKGVLQLGLAVPQDVSVTSFDGTDGTFACQPELTTLRRPIKKVAAEAIDLLLALIDSPKEESLHKRILIEPELTVRDSCAAV